MSSHIITKVQAVQAGSRLKIEKIPNNAIHKISLKGK